MSSLSGTSRSTSFDDNPLDMAEKPSKLDRNHSPAYSGSTPSFLYQTEHVAVVPAKDEEESKSNFNSVRERENGLELGLGRDLEASHRREETRNPDPPLTWPDGGWKAWGNIAGCTLISFTAFGQVNSFGVFQTYYASHQLADRSASEISWIGSVQVTLLYISGLFLGRVLDIYGARGLLTAGCVLSIFSVLMLSLSKTYYQIFLSQGVALGLGVALQFYPLLVIPSHWFKFKRSAVVGIVVAGSSLGGVVFPIMLSNLFDRIGFAWSVRAMALLMLVIQAISIPLIKERLPPLKNKKLFDVAALREGRFVSHCAAGFFSGFGIFTPVWYIELFMLSRGASSSLAFYSIAIMNGSAVFGRIVSGYIGDYFGRFNTLVPLAVIQAVAVLAIWTTSKTIAQTLVFAVIFGFASSSFLSVASSCVAQITKDQTRIGTRTGMFMAAMAPGVLAGPPIAGALLSLRSSGGGSGGREPPPDGDSRYLWTQLFGGLLLLTGAGFALVTRVACSRKILTKV